MRVISVIQKFFAVTAIFIALLVISCQNSNPAEEAHQKIRIVTTTSLIKDAVINLTGNSAEVESLMGTGVDPHLYKATQGDLNKLLKANLIVYNGHHLEGKMSDILYKLRHRKPVFAMAESLADSLLRKVPGSDDIFDPHIWFDVRLWSAAVDNLAVFLMDNYPELSPVIRANHTIYAQKLDSLHYWVIQSIRKIPAEQRVLITAHDAFGYFGTAYGMEVRGLQGISTLSEYGLRDITELARFITERKIKAVFIETSVPEKSIYALLEGCRQRGWDVQLGGSLYSDAPGPEGTPEGTYIGMFRYNVMTMVDALQ